MGSRAPRRTVHVAREPHGAVLGRAVERRRVSRERLVRGRDRRGRGRRVCFRGPRVLDAVGPLVHALGRIARRRRGARLRGPRRDRRLGRGARGGRGPGPLLVRLHGGRRRGVRGPGRGGGRAPGRATVSGLGRRHHRAAARADPQIGSLDRGQRGVRVAAPARRASSPLRLGHSGALAREPPSAAARRALRSCGALPHGTKRTGSAESDTRYAGSSRNSREGFSAG